jgi:hypothetical protein
MDQEPPRAAACGPGRLLDFRGSPPLAAWNRVSVRSVIRSERPPAFVTDFMSQVARL